MATGWITISRTDLLKALGLPEDVMVEGVRWFPGTKELKVVVQGEAIPYPGGEIVNLDPIETEKQLRDAAVAKANMEAEGRELLEHASRLP